MKKKRVNNKRNGTRSNRTGGCTYPIVCQMLDVLSEAEVDILLLCGIRVRPAVAGMVVLERSRALG